jgi:hypothetical protein
MARSQWHKVYITTIAAPAEVLFALLADMPEGSLQRQWVARHIWEIAGDLPAE